MKGFVFVFFETLGFGWQATPEIYRMFYGVEEKILPEDGAFLDKQSIDDRCAE